LGALHWPLIKLSITTVYPFKNFAHDGTNELYHSPNHSPSKGSNKASKRKRGKGHESPLHGGKRGHALSI